jgi:hypothetical protein
MGGHVGVAELLLSNGAGLDKMAKRVCGCKHATLNCADRHDTAPGLWKQEEVDRKLLKQDVLVTPLHVAQCHQQQEMALMLIRQGAARCF